MYCYKCPSRSTRINERSYGRLKENNLLKDFWFSLYKSVMLKLQHNNAREDWNEFSPLPFPDEWQSQIVDYLLKLIHERKEAERKLFRSSSGLRFGSWIYSHKWSLHSRNKLWIFIRNIYSFSAHWQVKVILWCILSCAYRISLLEEYPLMLINRILGQILCRYFDVDFRVKDTHYTWC